MIDVRNMEHCTFSRRNPERKRRPSSMTVPTNVCPHVKLLFSEMQRRNIRYDDVEDGSGVKRAALKAWRHRNYPSLDGLTAALNFVGWSYVPIPNESALPPEILAELRPVADRLGMTMPQAMEALVSIVAGIGMNTARAA